MASEDTHFVKNGRPIAVKTAGKVGAQLTVNETPHARGLSAGQTRATLAEVKAIAEPTSAAGAVDEVKILGKPLLRFANNLQGSTTVASLSTAGTSAQLKPAKCFTAGYAAPALAYAGTADTAAAFTPKSPLQNLVDIGDPSLRPDTDLSGGLSLEFEVATSTANGEFRLVDFSDGPPTQVAFAAAGLAQYESICVQA